MITIMEKYIHDENLKLFRMRLAEAKDEKQRQTLQVLIEEEEAKIPRRTVSGLKHNRFRPDA